MVSRDFLLRGMLSGLGRRCQCFFGTGSPISTLFPFWVADVAIGRRCLGELSAMYADIGNLSGLFAVEAVGILLACTTGHRCRHSPGYRTFGVSGTAARFGDRLVRQLVRPAGS